MLFGFLLFKFGFELRFYKGTCQILILHLLERSCEPGVHIWAWLFDIRVIVAV
jgi:hypothetical protein